MEWMNGWMKVKKIESSLSIFDDDSMIQYTHTQCI